MSKENSFVLKNASSEALTVVIEPEAHEVLLQPHESIAVRETFQVEPLTLQFSTLAHGTVVSIWPGDGSVSVTKDGVDLLGRQ